MKKVKFTFIDFFIIFFALAVIVTGVFFLKSGAGSDTEMNKVHFTVLATNQQKGISELINEGDDVVISFSEDVHATVSEAYEEDRKDYYFNTFTGRYVQGKVQGKSDVYVKLTADADITDTAIIRDGLPIRVGDEMPVRGKGYVVLGYVVDVTEE